MKEKIAACGGRRIESMAHGEVVRGDIAHFGYYVGGTGWSMFESARLVGGEHCNAELTLKGKRNPSHFVWLERALVR